MMNKAFSFNKHAKTYAQNSFIQDKIAHKLVNLALDFEIQSICDLGAGSGNVAKNISQIAREKNLIIDYFLGIDNSREMLLTHPLNLPQIRQIELVRADFDEYEFKDSFDLLISSSALHWTRNLDLICEKIAHLAPKIAFGIFTNKSLDSLHNFLGTRSPLLESSAIVAILEKYFSGEIMILKECEVFKNAHEMLAHLRKNGIFGGGNLSFEIKKKLALCELNKIEYEIICFVGKIKEQK